nr:hypothetical protein BDOA9_0206610 [Bradyrhizobium sp. DOA9]
MPHVAMFPIDLLLPHLFCSLARGAKEAGRTTGGHSERADVAFGPRPSACQANRPVIGRGQGRQPPKAVAQRASLEHGRSPVYFTPPFLHRAAAGFPVMRRGSPQLPKPGSLLIPRSRSLPVTAAEDMAKQQQKPCRTRYRSQIAGI